MDQFVRRTQGKYYRQAKDETLFAAKLLFYVQLSLIVFLLITIGVVLMLTPLPSRIAYLLIVCSLLALLGASMWMGLCGRYRLAFWVTTLLLFAGPWASILYERFCLTGDFVPMIYLVIPIQITALFIRFRYMQVFSALQAVALIALVLTDPYRTSYNWPSMICFVVVISLLGTITNLVLRKQYDCLVHSKNALAQSEERMRDIAIRDPLTGLYNRRHMDEAFSRQFDKPAPHFSLLMVDVDHLKDVNDTYGHRYGDEMIQSVASILMDSIRKDDVACRYGGDEFLLILSDCTLDSAMAKARKIKSDVENLMTGSRRHAPAMPTVSIGAAQCPLNGTDRDAMLKAVDSALYMAKQSGRNRINAAEGLYTSALTDEAR